MPQVSIIVPVYKVEPYIRRCLDSILAQTFTDWECILVDDGSPDACGVICDEYVARDERFMVIHQENSGVNIARKNGVELASGEWVNFIDPDDFIPSTSLEKLLSFANEDSAIVCGNGVCKLLPPDCGWSLDEFVRTMLVVALGGSPCARLYRRIYLTEFVFDIPRNITVGEDLIMNVRYAFTASGKVVSCPHVVYIYEPNENGATSGFAPDWKYQQRFLHAKLAAIPAERHFDFMKEICHANVFWWLSSTKDKVLFEKGEYAYYLELRALVKGVKLPLSSYLKVLFYCANPVVRFVVIYMKKLLSSRVKD